MIRGALTELRPITPDDLPLLTSWFADPEIYRWWGGVPKSPAEVARECVGYGKGVEALQTFVIVSGGEPVGYIQAWNDVPRVGGIDVVLLPNARDRGLGSDAVRALARHLRDEAGWTRIIVDPLIRNARAIRAFAKAGFVREREALDHPDGPSLIMAFEPERDAAQPGHAPAGPECTSVDPAGD